MVLKDFNDQPAQVQADPAQGVSRSPFGGKKGVWLVLRKEINADESAPTTKLQCIQAPTYERMKFAVEVPAGVTAYTVHIGRWIETEDKGQAIDGWFEEQVHSKNVSATFDVELARDPVGIYVDNIVGTPASSIHILYQRASQNPT